MWGVLSPSLFFSLLLASVALDLVQGEATLDVKWGITLGEVDNSDDNLKFLLQWMTSNYIWDDNVQVELLEPVNCAAPVGFTETREESVDGAPFWGPDVVGVGSPQNSNGLGIRNYMQEVNINAFSIFTNPALFRYTSPLNQTATMSFCSRFSLKTGDTVVNFLETIIALYVDLTDGFEIVDISVAAKDRLEEIFNIQNEVVANFCYGEPPQDLTPEQVGNLPQGTTVQVCVRPSPDAIAFGLVMRRIDSFTWTRRDPNTGGVTTQDAVTGGSSANALTELYCPNDGTADVCYFRTLIKADFFALSLPAPPPGFTLPPAIAFQDAEAAGTSTGNDEENTNEEDEEATEPPLVEYNIPSPTIANSFELLLTSGEASSDASISRARRSLSRSLSVGDITDGLLSTSWTSSADDDEPWVLFDMNGYEVIRNFEIKWRDGYCATIYKIQVSNDKVSWTDVSEVYFDIDEDRIDYSVSSTVNLNEECVIATYNETEYEEMLNGGCYEIVDYGRFVRIKMVEPCTPAVSPSNPIYSIREVKVWGHGVEGNYDVTVSGSSLNPVGVQGSSVWVEGYSDAANAIDGTAGTFWRSAGPSAGEYLTVELDDYFELTEIQIDWYGTNFPNILKIQTSFDGSVFTAGFDYPITGSSNHVTTITKADLDDMYLDNMVKHVRIYGQSGSRPMGIRDLRVEGILPMPLRESIATPDAPSEITDSDLLTGFLIDTAIGTNKYGLVIPLPFWYTISSFDAVVGYDSSIGIKYSVDGANFFSAGYLQAIPSGSNTIYRMAYDEEAKYVRLECYGSPCTVKDISILGYKTIPQPTELSLTPIQVTSNAENAALAVDGDATTSWVSDPIYGDPTFTVDLGNWGYNLRHFTIKFREDRYPIQFLVETNNRNVDWYPDWSTAWSKYYFHQGTPETKAVSPTWHESFTGAVYARYVRIRVLNMTNVDTIEIEDFSVEGFLEQPLPIWISSNYFSNDRYYTSNDYDVSNYPNPKEQNLWAPIEVPAWYGYKLLSNSGRWDPFVISYIRMYATPGYEPEEYALEVSTDEIGSWDSTYTNPSWTRVLTVSDATNEPRGRWNAIEIPVWAKLVRLVILEHGPANETRIEKIYLYGFNEEELDREDRRLSEQGEYADPYAIPYDEEDSSRRLEHLGDSRILQTAPIVIGGAGVATLRYPGRRQAALRAGMEQQRLLQDADLIPEALLEEGAPFALEAGIVPLVPRDFSSGHHALARWGTISLGATVASAFVAMAMWLV